MHRGAGLILGTKKRLGRESTLAGQPGLIPSSLGNLISGVGWMKNVWRPSAPPRAAAPAAPGLGTGSLQPGSPAPTLRCHRWEGDPQTRDHRIPFRPEAPRKSDRKGRLNPEM